MTAAGAPGTTPIDPDAAADLIPDEVTTREELDTRELSNIAKCEAWAFSTRHRELLSPKFLRDLHRRMFDEVWQWAGHYRTTEKNIGVDPAQIATAVHGLCADVREQVDRQAYGIDEIAARLAHRLVLVHPFPNGNGRHARMVADLLLVEHGQSRFTWGRGGQLADEDLRACHLRALRSADAGDFAPLFRFVRS